MLINYNEPNISEYVMDEIGTNSNNNPNTYFLYNFRKWNEYISNLFTEFGKYEIFKMYFSHVRSRCLLNKERISKIQKMKPL